MLSVVSVVNAQQGIIAVHVMPVHMDHHIAICLVPTVREQLHHTVANVMEEMMEEIVSQESQESLLKMDKQNLWKK